MHGANHPVVQTYLAEARAVTHRVGRSFAWATRLLPHEVRDDVYLLYMVMRTLDDVVDTRQHNAVAHLNVVLDWLNGAPAIGREATALAYLFERYGSLRREAVADFCEGMLEDLAGPRFETEADLDRYAYRVAGTVGRLMSDILGARDPRALCHAEALGIAMQRTNVLRDIDEDLALGRIYLPRATLESAGIRDLARDDRTALLRHEIALADAWYDRGLAGTRYLPRGARQICAAALMYREILRQIERDGLGVRRPHRSSVSAYRKAWISLRAFTFAPWVHSMASSTLAAHDCVEDRV